MMELSLCRLMEKWEEIVYECVSSDIFQITGQFQCVLDLKSGTLKGEVHLSNNSSWQDSGHCWDNPALQSFSSSNNCVFTVFSLKADLCGEKWELWTLSFWLWKWTQTLSLPSGSLAGLMDSHLKFGKFLSKWHGICTDTLNGNPIFHPRHLESDISHFSTCRCVE